MKLIRLSAFMIALTLCFSLIGCTPTVNPPDETPDTPAQICLLSEDGTTPYTVIRPNTSTISLRTAIQQMTVAFKEKSQTKITQASDWSANKEYSDFEILIGETNRPESTELFAQLAYNEYAVAVINQKLVICGGCSAATESAVKYFTDKLLRQPFTYTEGLIYKATATPEEMIFHIMGEETSETFTLAEGVTRTHYTTGKNTYYGMQDINVTEIDFNANPNLTFRVASYDESDVTTLSTVKDTVEKYNDINTEGLTVLEAVNGDMWMTNAHARREGTNDRYGNTTNAVVTSTFTVPRAYNVHNGEIISSAHIAQETPYEDDFYCFGLSADGKFYLGCPQLSIRIQAPAATFNADGLNRLPADDALIVYSDRVNETHSLSDAYEIVLACDDYTVCHGTSVTGTVTAVYTPSDKGTVTIKDNQICLTARGNRTKYLEGVKIGDTVTVSFSVSDRMGNDAAWQNMVYGDAGHIPLIVNGISQNSQNPTRIPTTMMGLKANGNLVILTNDGYAQNASFSEGLMISQLDELCQELGVVTAFVCDGGGSTTLVERQEDGTYAVLNHPSDGHERKVSAAVMICTK